MLLAPFYDPAKSYDENFEQGPFGAFAPTFADGEVGAPSPAGVGADFQEPQYDFLDQKIHSPFGIPAGPLLNGKFCKAAFQKGFDICVYKTVRSGVFPCHPFPNVLSVKVVGDLTYEKAQNKLTADGEFEEPLSITNSFGVPSKDPVVWQEDARFAISSAGPGQVLILSFMGTAKEGQTKEEFISDYVLAAKLSKDTGAKILEVNLSCPNIGNEGLVCYDLDMTEEILKRIRKEIGEVPLILKVGYYKDDGDINKLAGIAEKYGQAIAAINTISAQVVDEKGNQALPGLSRLRSGVCGASIKWAGLEMVRRLKKIREEKGFKFRIIGVGGVMTAQDFFEYRENGADVVMSATGAMWNPYLAADIKEKLL